MKSEKYNQLGNIKFHLLAMAWGSLTHMRLAHLCTRITCPHQASLVHMECAHLYTWMPSWVNHYPLGFGAGTRGLGDTFRVDGGDMGWDKGTLGFGAGTLGLMGGTLPFRFWGWDKGTCGLPFRFWGWEKGTWGQL